MRIRTTTRGLMWKIQKSGEGGLGRKSKRNHKWPFNTSTKAFQQRDQHGNNNIIKR